MLAFAWTTSQWPQKQVNTSGLLKIRIMGVKFIKEGSQIQEESKMSPIDLGLELDGGDQYGTVFNIQIQKSVLM